MRAAIARRHQLGPYEVFLIAEPRLDSRWPDPRTGLRRNLGTFTTRAAAEKHERAVQFFKRHG